MFHECREDAECFMSAGRMLSASSVQGGCQCFISAGRMLSASSVQGGCQ